MEDYKFYGIENTNTIYRGNDDWPKVEDIVSNSSPLIETKANRYKESVFRRCEKSFTLSSLYAYKNS